MSEDRHRYLSLDRTPRVDNSRSVRIAQFYEQLTHPAAIVVVLCTLALLVWNDLIALAKRVQDDVFHTGLVILYVLVNLAIGLRLIQSYMLAKRDYANLRAGTIWDIFVFFLVLVFTAGFIPRKLLEVCGSMIEVILWISLTYVVIAIVGIVHFYKMQQRIKHDSHFFDYPIEQRIQRINFLVCAAYAGLFLLGSYCSYNAKNSSEPSWALYVVGCLAIAVTALNIEHSQSLTFRPKVLLSNRKDRLHTVLAEIKSRLAQCEWIKLGNDKKLLEALVESHQEDMEVSTVRCGREDSHHMAETLYSDFGYAFAYVFFGYTTLTKHQERKLLRVMQRLIVVACGFGHLGYMNYYYVLSASGVRVGILGITGPALAASVLYKVWEWIALPLIVLRHFGLKAFLGIRRRFRDFMRFQAQPNSARELCVTHFAIFPQHRRQGYGIASIRLVVNAYLRDRTDDLYAEQIKLVIRSPNVRAIEMVRRAGFNQIAQNTGADIDPISALKFKGQPIGDAFVFVRRREFTASHQQLGSATAQSNS